MQQLEQPENARLLRVAIVGCPNAGKSTLLNQLIDRKISAVSSKVHTTQKNVIGVYVENNVQIEFVDTPGVINLKHMMRHNLELTFINDLKYSIQNCDIITILTDVSNQREQSKLNKGVLSILKENPEKESILVLNKVDKIKDKRSFLEIISTLTNNIVGGENVSTDHSEREQIKFELKHAKFDTLFKRTEQHYFNYKDQEQSNENENGKGWSNFSRVFMLSALNNDGVDNLRKYFIQKAMPKSWIYNGNIVTPQNPQRLIIETIREICLESFIQEIPYKLHFRIVMWEIDELENLYLVVDIFCPEKFLSLVIGPKGSTISKIVNHSRESLSNTFRCDVSLKIAVKSFR